MQPRTIAVTGVTRGLGRALILEFSAHGHRLTGCARSQTALDQLAQLLPAPALLYQADVTDRNAVARWAQSAIAELGPPDLLINNAGILHPNTSFLQTPADAFDRVVQVAVQGTANVLRAFLPAMLERRRGVIVNLSSGAGVEGFPNISSYCTAKHAIEGLSKSLAREVPDTMAVVPWQPGVINTDMLRAHYGARAADHETPEDWAQRAVPALLALGPSDNGRSLRLA